MRWIEVNWARRLGHGGEATVYYARYQDTGQEIAVKIPHGYDTLARIPEMRAVLRRQLQREVERHARVRGQHIVQMLDFNLDADIPFIALEFAQGSLRDEISARRAQNLVLTVDSALATVREILVAIETAHASGIVHRDVKPENLLRFAGGALKLADFGLGRTLTRTFSNQTRGFVGTRNYAAPEQTLAQFGLLSVDQRADIYAAGVILFELLSNQTPQDIVPPKVAAILGTTAGLDGLLERFLAFEPARRPLTARVALAELDRVRVQVAEHAAAQQKAALQQKAAIDALLGPVCPRCGQRHGRLCPRCGQYH